MSNEGWGWYFTNNQSDIKGAFASREDALVHIKSQGLTRDQLKYVAIGVLVTLDIGAHADTEDAFFPLWQLCHRHGIKATLKDDPQAFYELADWCRKYIQLDRDYYCSGAALTSNELKYLAPVTETREQQLAESLENMLGLVNEDYSWLPGDRNNINKAKKLLENK